jgi:hypothetical protein
MLNGMITNDFQSDFHVIVRFREMICISGTISGGNSKGDAGTIIHQNNQVRDELS